MSDPSQAGDKVPGLLSQPVRSPTRSVIPLDDATIDRVAQTYSQVEQDQGLRMGEITAVLRAGQLVYPWMQYALLLINQVADERPVYFASSGNAASSLGLDPYLVRQGLAFKLNRTPLENGPPDGVVRMAQSPYAPVVGDWVDVPRTRALLEEVFQHRTGIPDEWSHWPDEATVGIPNYYAWAYLALTQAALQAGDEEAVARYQERTEAWTALGS